MTMTPDEMQAAKEANEEARARGRDLRAIRLRRLLKDRDFREWLWDVLAFCNIAGALDSADPRVGQAIGRRDVGVMLLQDLGRADPTAYPRMMQEHATQESETDER